MTSLKYIFKFNYFTLYIFHAFISFFSYSYSLIVFHQEPVSDVILT